MTQCLAPIDFERQRILRSYRVNIGADLVLRVTDPRSGDEVATAHLFDVVAQTHVR